jgi:hypothetical protein
MNGLTHNRLLAAVLLSLACASLFGGCLTAERKEYHFTLRPDGSGTGTITFLNIMSDDEESKNVSAKDYAGLVTDFYKGKKFEEQNPSYSNVRKRLYEKDGKLNAEITFDFLSYEDAGLYRHEGKGPWMFFSGSSAAMTVEHYDTANGTYGGERMPVIFWPEGTTEFRIATRISDPDESMHSLLPYFKRSGTD